jgi:hypothetical protein
MKAFEHVCECGENNWIITKRTDCGNCPDTSDEEQVEYDGECEHGPAYGGGCWLLTCKQCGLEDYLPFMDW